MRARVVAFGLAGAGISLLPYEAAWAIPAALLILAGLVWTLLAPARWMMAFLCAAVLLPPLPIALGDSGPHPCLALAAIGLLAGLVWMPEWRVPSDSLSRALVLFFFVLLLSVSLAAVYSGAATAAGTLARVALFGISVYLFLYLTSGPARGDASDGLAATRVLLGAAAAAAAFACIDFWFQLPAPAGYGPQFIWTDAGVFRRAQGLFYEASTLGNFCVFFLVGAVVLPGSRLLRVAASVLLGAALIFSYSRASMLNLAIAGLALLALKARRRLPAVAATLAVAVAAAWLAAPAFVELSWRRLSGSLVYFFTSPESVLSGRIASWRLLLDFVAAHPWHAILGVGYKTLPYSDVAGQPIVADNMYLSMLVETGVVGLGALVYLNASILRAAWRARASFFGVWIFSFWCGQLFQMLSGDLLTYWRVLPLYFWVLAMAVRSTHEHPVS